MFTITCTDCKERFTGKDEYEAEVLFNQHYCEISDALDKLPLMLLRKVALGELTVEEAISLANA